jgi:hypothetical protein
LWKPAERKKAKARAEADKKGDEKSRTKADARQDTKDADYKVAVEKCDAMKGDAKDKCVAQAKARFGKS